jgi:hypothetical protein
VISLSAVLGDQAHVVCAMLGEAFYLLGEQLRGALR